MTIKELEQRVGMTRTNIRFYEQEGLLTPARSPNGYRDYSEADAETLEKIKLLRRLHVDLDTIRALQRGQTALPEALARQIAQLERDSAALDGATAVCRRLQAQGVDYAALRPAPWLEELDRAPVSERLSPPEDRLPPPPGHPWQRYFARSFDLVLYNLPFTVLGWLVFHFPLSILSNSWYGLFRSYLAIALMFLLEPLLLHRWGTTPGKALFGIRLQTREGERPTCAQARYRLGLIFSRGMGYGIPFYRLYRYYKSYTTCQAEERLEWEGPLPFREEDPAMTVSGTGVSWVRYGVARLACLGLALLISAQAWVPPHHRGLSEAEFYENWNFYARWTGATHYQLGGDGRFADEGASLWGNDVDRQWSPIYTGDELVGFRCVVQADTTPGSTLLAVHQSDNFALGLLAWVGGQNGGNGLTLSPRGWLKRLPEGKANYDLTYDGVRITQQVRLTNLAALPGADGVYTVMDEDLGGHLRLEFTVQSV